MKIDISKCVACKTCHPYCPVGAISLVELEDSKVVSEINQVDCVECGVCLRANVCHERALYMPDLQWPRTIRAIFSDPVSIHPSTDVRGRGTNEMKTNDVTGRYKHGYTGVLLEMGRPGVGTNFRNLQKVCMGLAAFGVEFEAANPINTFMTDKKKGKFRDDILEEKVLSAIIEFTLKDEKLSEALYTIKGLAREIDTVFSLSLISRIGENGRIPMVSIAKRAGFVLYPNTKTNLGLGRPLKGEERNDTYSSPERK